MIEFLKEFSLTELKYLSPHLLAFFLEFITNDKFLNNGL